MAAINFDENKKTYEFEFETSIPNTQKYLLKVLKEVFNSRGQYEYRDKNHCIHMICLSSRMRLILIMMDANSVCRLLVNPNSKLFWLVQLLSFF